MGDTPTNTKPARPRFYRKRLGLIQLIAKIRIWPPRSWQLPGLRLSHVETP